MTNINESENIVKLKVKQTEPTERHTLLDFPSKNIFYPSEVKAIYGERFSLTQIDAMSSAKNSNDFAKFVRVLGQTITVPIEMLTQDDYQYLCYWHRVNSYPRKPLTLSWECKNMKHIEFAQQIIPDDASKEFRENVESARKNLKNTVRVYKTDQFDVNIITPERHKELVKFLKDPDRHTKGMLFIPPTVGDLIELTEIANASLRKTKLDALELSPENLEKVLDEITEVSEGDIIMRTASNLNAQYGNTLQERMDYVRKQSQENPDLYNADFLAELEIFEELSDHSVTESIKGKCKHRGCEQAVDLTVEFDLFSFFPFI